MSSPLASELAAFSGIASAGYAIGLHIKFTSPTYLFQTYSEEWNDFYSAQGLVMRDPTVAWMLENVGAVRWSTLTENDSMGVLSAAAKHGMSFGVSISVLNGDSRSVGGFSRPDREFTDAEIAQLSAGMASIHHATANEATIDAADIETIKRLSVTA